MYDLIGHREDEVRDEIMLQGAPRPGGFASATSLCEQQVSRGGKAATTQNLERFPSAQGCSEEGDFLSLLRPLSF